MIFVSLLLFTPFVKEKPLFLLIVGLDINLLDLLSQIAVSKDETVILDGAGDKKNIEERCDQVYAAFFDVISLTIIAVSIVFVNWICCL